MKLFTKTAPFLAGLVVATSSFADTVTTTDGVVLKGKILKIHKGVMTLQTEFAGDISVKMEKVTAIKTDKPVSIETDDKQRLTGVVDASAEKILINDENSSSELKQGEVNMMWLPSEDAPDYVAPKKKEWQFTASGDWTKKAGNTDEDNFGLQFNGVLSDDIESIRIYLRYVNEYTNNVETDEEIVGGLDYERLVTPRSSWYARAELEKDEFEGIDFRSTIAAGYGYYFMKKENVKLRGRIGLFSRYEAYTDAVENSDTYGTDIGLRWDYKLPEKFSWHTDLVATPSLEDPSKVRFDHESALRLPIGDTDWYFRIGVRHEYNSEALADKEYLDTTYFSRLEVNF